MFSSALYSLTRSALMHSLTFSAAASVVAKCRNNGKNWIIFTKYAPAHRQYTQIQINKNENNNVARTLVFSRKRNSRYALMKLRKSLKLGKLEKALLLICFYFLKFLKDEKLIFSLHFNCFVCLFPRHQFITTKW